MREFTDEEVLLGLERLSKNLKPGKRIDFDQMMSSLRKEFADSGLSEEEFLGYRVKVHNMLRTNARYVAMFKMPAVQ